MKHKFTIIYEVGGQTEIEADSADKVLDIMHNHFKKIGVNKTLTRIIAIDGISTIQQREK